MDEQHEAHLNRIVTRLSADIATKYRKGQAEHGGNLWQKGGMLDFAIEEVIDLAVYLYTLKEQCEEAEKAL